MTLALAFVFGYLLGSIPFGLILTRAAGGPDIREIGSGNIGATNVLRTGRKGLAAATLLCDMLKGTVAVLVAARFGGPDASLVAALGAFLGHLFPVWLKFKGGKGVATYIGLLIGLYWPGAVIFCLICAPGAPPARWQRRQDRREGLNPHGCIFINPVVVLRCLRDACPVTGGGVVERKRATERGAASRLVAPHPQRQCRAPHLPRSGQHLRRRA